MLKNFINRINNFFPQSSMSMCVVGFASGFPFLFPLSIVDIWLKDVGISNTVIGFFAFLHVPYTLKFLLCPMVERYKFPFFSKKFGRIKGWALGSQFLLILSFIGIALSNPNKNLYSLMLFICLMSLFHGCQDIVLNHYHISKAKETDGSSVASTVLCGYRFGMLFAQSGSLYLAHFYNWPTAYFVMTCFVLVGVVFVFYTKEPDISIYEKNIECDIKEDLKFEAFQSFKKRKIFQFLQKSTIFKTLQGKKSINFYAQKINNFSIASVAILNRMRKYLTCIIQESVISPFLIFKKLRHWHLILLLILTCKSGDYMLHKMFKPFLIEIGFSKQDIASVVQIFGTSATFLGGFIGNAIAKKYTLIWCMIVTTIIHAFTNLLNIIFVYTGADIHYLYVVVFFDKITGGAMMMAFIAYFYEVCKGKYLNAQYSLLWAFQDVSGMFTKGVSGALVDACGWTIFFVISFVVFIPGIYILKFLRKCEVEETGGGVKWKM